MIEKRMILLKKTLKSKIQKYPSLNVLQTGTETAVSNGNVRLDPYIQLYLTHVHIIYKCPIDS